MTARQLQQVRRLLCRLGNSDSEEAHCSTHTQAADFTRIAAVTAADTIYQVDRLCEEAILAWFERHWPASWPVELVMEGLENESVTFPRGTRIAQDRV